jgi:phosphonate transport system permease protein
MTLSLPRPAAPLWPLLPALVLVPLVLLLPAISHGGGWGLVADFAAAALRPSLQPEVLRSVLQGLATTLAMAVLGWACSLGLGLLLGLASSRLVWEQGLGHPWPAGLIRRLLALPRAIHELIWGLALLQLLGLQPVVAVLAITIPFGALVARVVADQLDALPVQSLEGLRSAGAPAGAALLTALGPPLLPQLLSYGGYRLECALRSATLLGVFGLGGLGTELRLTLQSLAFRELWSGLWVLLLAMLLLEQLLGWLRRRWAMPSRLNLRAGGVGRSGRELLLAGLALGPLLLVLGWWLGVNPAGLLRWQPLPPLPQADWAAVAALPWPSLVGNTVLMTLLAAALAVGLAPLLLLLAGPWAWARWLVQAAWALGRLWPPPLSALLLLFVLQPGLVTGALALGFHNLGVLGRLLLESGEHSRLGPEQALACGGSAPRVALLYGRFSGLARSYLAYGVYRADVILRESVVVGLVGATGLGSQLMEALSAFAVDQLLALLLAYGLLTLVGEELSDRLRQRLSAASPTPAAAAAGPPQGA